MGLPVDPAQRGSQPPTIHTHEETLLAAFLNKANAQAGAVLRVTAGSTVVIVSRGLAAGQIAAACRLWAAQGPALRAGKPASDGTLTLVPVSDAGGMTGLLCVLVPNFAAAATQTLRLALAKALRASEIPQPEGFDGDEDERLRAQLVEALRLCRGNVSAVAKRLKVTRATVYARMRRFRLDRRSRARRPLPKN